MTKTDDSISLVSDDSNVARPRLRKLTIRNFHSIGTTPVEIALDEIVVLVGANNTGKSSILRAYEIVMNSGSKDGHLSIDDFPNHKVDANHFPEIELETIISENRPGEQWIQYLDNGELLIKERWIWSEPGKAPKRQGYDFQACEWSDKVPWGASNVANAYRPQPHRIDAFSPPEKQEAAIGELLTNIITERLKSVISPSNKSGKSDYEELLDSIVNFQKNVLSSVKDDIKNIEDGISQYFGQVFSNYVIQLNANPETNIEKTYTPFKESPTVMMGKKDGYMSSVASQGSGARRTLMWTALKYLKEKTDYKAERPHVLLLDEPEVCLHPAAIREARKVLYSLPQSKNWQVMITTHSPVFIDLSYDNTTIIRVGKNDNEEVISTTLYRPDRIKLSEDDKENLKLLNVCDPYVNEFFFGGRIIVVEGDTEYTAFSYIKMLYDKEYDDVHIIRARGKGIIPLICKILNQFSCDYAILHDADVEKTSTGGNNPAWSMNKTIMQETEKATGKVSLVACVKDFETALFNESVVADKPYTALNRIRGDIELRQRVKILFDGLLDPSKPLPDNCRRWNTLGDLK